MSGESLELRFWGVRGSIPTPVADNIGFGGNTSCLSVRYGDQPLVVFDAGSGIRALGLGLLDQVIAEKTELHLFLTHFHWDHIQGLPFFAPLYHPNCAPTIYSSVAPTDLERILGLQMVPPYYPVPMPASHPSVAYRVVEGGGMQLGDILVRPFSLNHPNGATGYRIEAPGACVVYASDHEHGDEAKDAILREFAEGADILIYDSQYTPAEYPKYRGWGHSTWEKAAKLAEEARVGKLVLFHHDPRRSDSQLKAIVSEAQAAFKQTMAAQEGWSCTLGTKR